MTPPNVVSGQARTGDLDRPLGFFRSHALTVLEFPRVLEVVAGYAHSSLGAARVLALTPSLDLDAVRAEHARVEAMRTLVSSEEGWQGETIPDLTAALARLRVPGTTLDGLSLREAGLLLGSARRTRDAIYADNVSPMTRALLVQFADVMARDAELERRLEKALDDDGSVRDDASPSLRRIRREMAGAEGELVRLLERLMAKLEPHHQVGDASVTVRNGRYVIPVRREGAKGTGGIVHDTSASGATVFIEPPAAVEAGNRIRELAIEEQREIERVLRELTDTLRPHHAALELSLEALVALDALAARARYALAARCLPSVLCAPAEGFAIHNGRHPLLLARGADVVPFDLTMLSGERTLLVSGPNTGGKTVLLKALALLSLMAQSGIPAPVGPESRLAAFDGVFADIGDEQSIEASLSTFSAHLKNHTEIVCDATPASLVLVDELGSGTDPLEGAALGGAILEALTPRGTLTIATTHLGALKELAQEVPGVVNASLQFDAVALAPTYRLIKGIPGRSYGLSIARRLEMPAAVIARAEERVPTVERDVHRLLEALEIRERESATLMAQLQADAADVHERGRRLAEREAEIKKKERELERASRHDARRYLLDARGDLEKMIASLKQAGAEGLEAAAAAARRGLEQRAGQERAALDELESRERTEAQAEAERRAQDARARSPREEQRPLGVGDAVAVATLGGKAGKLLELRGQEALVMVGALKLTVPTRTLTRISQRALRDRETAVAYIGDIPEVEAKHEVDVRGMRIGEVEDAVLQAIDSALRADLAELRIIHGKGTGALREKVGQMVKDDPRVKSSRLGAWNEGGAGVTLVSFQ
ncbi:MAG: endonuclease MutS2 [Gemmatimonadota bacterium]|nr:endonuclease MutS2 [Gemmatimonadota bacterium]